MGIGNFELLALYTVGRIGAITSDTLPDEAIRAMQKVASRIRS